MKTKRILLSLLICFSSIAVFAQHGPPPPGSRREERKDEIESMKVAYLTRRLDLTPDEAQKFWPVFNQFSDELKKAKKEHGEQKRSMNADLTSVSDKDVEKMVDGEIIFRQQEIDIIKKYHSQFKQVLPIKKVALLYSAEDDFKKELIEKLKDRKQDHQ